MILNKLLGMSKNGKCVTLLEKKIASESNSTWVFTGIPME
jgi:hypothetical protein